VLPIASENKNMQVLHTSKQEKETETRTHSAMPTILDYKALSYRNLSWEILRAAAQEMIGAQTPYFPA